MLEVPPIKKGEYTMKTNTDLEQDFEMLDEYDFSKGVRGKYYYQYQMSNVSALIGIQFVVDSQGKKTGVLIDLNEYQTIIDKYLTEELSETVYYLVDKQGSQKAIFLNFEDHLSLWEQIYDQMIGND